MKIYQLITLLLISTLAQAQIVDIPDANFKYALINLYVVDNNGDGIGDNDVDINNDGEIQESEAEIVSGLILPPNYFIYSIEGIESFINLIEIFIETNPLTEIDFSQNINLEKIYCNNNNQLSILDVSQCINLIELECRYNIIEEINVSQCINLKELWVFGNNLSNLNVSNNLELEKLSFGDNQISNIDVSQNVNLKMLSFDGTNVSTLDVSQNPNLEILFFSLNSINNLDLSQNHNLKDLRVTNSQLTNLNIKNGNNNNLIYMLTENNPNLTCIQVDDVDYANNQYCDDDNWCKDEWTNYSENCILGITNFDLYNINIYPNPVQNTLNIITEFPIDLIKIYTLQGQLLNETKNNQVDVSLLSSGLYFVSVTIEGKK